MYFTLQRNSQLYFLFAGAAFPGLLNGKPVDGFVVIFLARVEENRWELWVIHRVGELLGFNTE